MPRSTPSHLYRRKGSPFWWAKYTLPDGTPDRKSTGCRDHGAASAWLADRELDRVRVGAGIPTAKQVELLFALAEYVLEAGVKWSQGWKGTVEGFYTHQVVPYFGEKRIVATITRPEVETFRARQVGRKSLRSKRNPRQISPTTVNRLMATLATFGKWCAAKDRWYHRENPFEKHAPFAENDREIPAYTAEEVALFIAKLPEWTLPGRGPKYPARAIMTVAIDTGFRKSELERLKESDNNLRARTTKAVASWQRGQNKGKKTREQALTVRAAEALRWIKENAPRTDGLVFGRIGDLRRTLERAAREAGLGHGWFHLARHLGATRAGETGATLPELMAWGGWSNPRMVKKYAHADMRRLRAIADRMEAMNPPAEAQTEAPSSTIEAHSKRKGGQRDANPP